MKSLRTMSMIAIGLFAISLIFILVFSESDPEAAAGWGLIAVLYGIPFSVVCYLRVSKLVPKAES